MAHVIECDSCHAVMPDGAPHFTVTRSGDIGIQVLGARTSYDVCDVECLAQVAANLMEATC